MKKTINYPHLLLTALLLTTGCSQTSNPIQEKSVQEKTEQHLKHWGYTGDEAPSHWSELDASYKMCSMGKQQSPINIVSNLELLLPPLDLNYTLGANNIIDNGHTVQVNIQSGNNFNIDGENYELKQFHFHTPSENHIEGQSFPLEAHFVHATKDGKLAVIAVMFKEGEANPILAKIWNTFPLKEGITVDLTLSVDEVKALMPNDKKAYYTFLGSLTTPPCTEGVKWHVYKTPLTISKEQVKQFYDLFGHNDNRPLQETNDRVIEE